MSFTPTAIFGYLSVVTGIIALVIYFYDTLKHGVRPSRMTWFIWSVIVIINLYTQILQGAHDSIPFLVINVIAPVSIFILSIFKGTGGFTRVDIASLSIAAIGIIGWQVTKNPSVSLYCNILADMAGAVPTVRNSYANPQSESLTSWSFATIYVTFGLLSAYNSPIEVVIYPLYILCANALITGVIFWRRRALRVAVNNI